MLKRGAALLLVVCLILAPATFFNLTPKAAATTAMSDSTETYNFTNVEALGYLNVLVPPDAQAVSVNLVSSSDPTLTAFKLMGTFSMRAYRFAQIALTHTDHGQTLDTTVSFSVTVQRQAVPYAAAGADALSDTLVARLVQYPLSGHHTPGIAWTNLNHASEWRGYPVFSPAKTNQSFILTGNTDYVIVTSAAETSAVAQFAALKNAQVVTVETITSNYEGSTTQNRTLEFLKDAWNTWHFHYLLIVGAATTLTPILYTRSTFGTPTPSDTDYYFSTLEQPSSSFTQTEDPVPSTSYPESFPFFTVGRLPSDDPASIQTMLTKTIAYETAPPSAWVDDKLVITGSSDLLSATNNVLAFSSQPVTNISPYSDFPFSSFSTALNQGYGGVVISDHANPGVWSLPENNSLTWNASHLLGAHNVPSLTNTRLPVIFSSGCGSNSWYYLRGATTSAAQTLMTIPHGAVAIVGGTSMTPTSDQVYLSTYGYYDNAPDMPYWNRNRLPDSNRNIGTAFYYFTTLDGGVEYMTILGDPSVVIPTTIPSTALSAYGAYHGAATVWTYSGTADSFNLYWSLSPSLASKTLWTNVSGATTSFNSTLPSGTWGQTTYLQAVPVVGGAELPDSAGTAHVQAAAYKITAIKSTVLASTANEIKVRLDYRNLSFGSISDGVQIGEVIAGSAPPSPQAIVMTGPLYLTGYNSTGYYIIDWIPGRSTVPGTYQVWFFLWNGLPGDGGNWEAYSTKIIVTVTIQ